MIAKMKINYMNVVIFFSPLTWVIENLQNNYFLKKLIFLLAKLGK
jgi:hypothetical protein